MEQINNFKSIFLKYDTDKINPGNYHVAYEPAFGHIRQDIKLLFEIGVGRGGSVQAFHEYFPNAKIVGLENAPQFTSTLERLKLENGDATNPDFIKTILQKYGNPDIVIDDGSHTSRDVKASFNLLSIPTKFCYVIEDYGTQFMDFHDGYYVNDGIPAMNIVHQEVDKIVSTKNENLFQSIRVHPSICFFFK